MNQRLEGVIIGVASSLIAVVIAWAFVTFVLPPFSNPLKAWLERRRDMKTKRQLERNAEFLRSVVLSQLHQPFREFTRDTARNYHFSVVLFLLLAILSSVFMLFMYMLNDHTTVGFLGIAGAICF